MAGTIIGTALGAGIAYRAYQLIRAERSAIQAAKAADRPCAFSYERRAADPIHPDQDCNGDMQAKSPVRAQIEAVQSRANHFGGAHRLRYPSRWKARFVEPRPEPQIRDWA